MKPRNDRLRKRLPRWLRLQFALRSLLLFTLVVCLALGWYLEHERRRRLSGCRVGTAHQKLRDANNHASPFP